MNTPTQPTFTTSPVEGVEIRINPKNKFLVFQLHYSADPKKRDESYRDSIKSSMPLANYLQEFELNWDTFIGTPVYRDFQKRIHVSDRPLQPESGLPLLIGMDFGLTPAAIVAQLQGEQLLVLREFQEFNMGTERFCKLIMPQLLLSFPGWSDFRSTKNWLFFADPAGANRDQSNEGTSYKKITEVFGAGVRPGAIDWETRKGAVEHFLLRTTKEGPGLLIDPSCTHFIRGMEGGYRYPERAAEIEMANPRPIKDEHSHIQDAFQMICTNLYRPKREGVTKIKSPSYSSRPQATPSPERSISWHRRTP